MNKAFNRYGKASFRSTRPRRVRARNAWRRARAAGMAMAGFCQLQSILNAHTSTPLEAVGKSLAMVQCALATTQTISDIMRGRV